MNRSSTAPSCECNLYFYDDGSANCAACAHKCKTCLNSPDNCTGLECRGDRDISNDCKCPDGKFDDGTS